MMELPFSQACENNQQPILEQLATFLNGEESILEVGSGTGQHAVYFAKKLPNITWFSADLAINHPHLTQRFKESTLANICGPLELDLSQDWLTSTRPLLANKAVSVVYSANTLHIVSWTLVEHFFTSVSELLPTHGLLFVYGPFNYQGRFTSPSNAEFDLWLKERDAQSGIRDIEAIVKLANQQKLTLKHDIAMPANNRFLVFQKE
ncbi:methylase [Thalassotalea marina]|uniref:Methylase n=2 Tax=Thalassotalea marina TaxID=1673741 RepID=A0A919EM47_9GAMM|nr:methylase [Thalassotalea marina]